ncbi:MAG: hypothetical protein JSV89_05990 [Spirochaetaceae bacterium]|nr:MAG: hypothetical protein JSV89_05990 [Spirochaetaceae bacterium]
MRTILLALFLCLIAAVNVQARGRAERESRQRLGEVEKLIEEKRYNDAVRLLSEVVREDPDRFDAAEKLMERIRARRVEIDQSFADLNAAVRENDLEQVVALMDRLEELNPYPSEAEAELLDMLRAAGVEQIYFVNIFRDLMARARAQIEAGQYRQAVSTYLEGFQISKDRFDEAEYGNIIKNSVNGALDDLTQAIRAHDSQFTNLSSTADGFGADAQALPSEVAAVALSLESMAEALGTVERSGLTFQVQNRQIRENSADGQFDLFLFFSEQLVFGPSNSSTEGIVYALDAIWRRESAALESGLLRRGETAYAAMIDAFRTQSLEQALGSITEARALFASLLELQSLWPLRIEPTFGFPTDASGRSAVASALPDFLRTQEYLRALEDYQLLVQVVDRSSELEVQDISTIEQIYTDREEIAGLLEQTAALGSEWRDQLAFYREGAGLEVSLEAHASQASEVLSDIGTTLEVIQALDLRMLDRIARVQGAEFEEQYRRYAAQFEEGVRLQEGLEVALEPILDADGQVIDLPVRVEKFPSRALAIYQPLSQNLAELAAGVDRMLEDALKNEEYVQQSEELQTHVRSLRSLVNRNASLQEELEGRLADARQASLQAERYRREGELRYQQALSNVNNGRYEEAQGNIRSAREAFDTSLNIQEDSAVRRRRDQDLVALSERIIEELKGLVIREVRQLIENARRLYAQGDFTGAEQTLMSAQDRWTRAYATENPEVSFWLGLVRSAVDATTGREIAVTDPLYKEMSQLYNLAYGDFQSGQQLIQQGNTRAALEVLGRAENRIAKILVPFPYNARARVLNLRILQISDPDAFRTRITGLYNDALRRRTESPQEAYATLKDIEQLLPNYPGLQNAIANLEITLGFRIPPPDPAKIARSRELYLQARTYWDTNQRDFFPVALEQLNEAIGLNPDNREAVALKDRLLVATGGERVDVLSSDDQRLLREAEAKYLAGDYFEALVIIEQLLKKPGNQNNQEILDLEKRIRARTG